MVYLKKTTEAQVVMIPKNGESATGTLILKVRNTINETIQTFSVSDLNTSDLYFNLAVELQEDIVPGEYQYSLEDDGIVVSNGLLIIGEPSEPSQYESEIEYQQYESE